MRPIPFLGFTLLTLALAGCGEPVRPLSPEGRTLLAELDRMGPYTDWLTVKHLDAPINSASKEATPALSKDELTLYFASDRLQSGDWDLWVATRHNRNVFWNAPTRLPATVNKEGSNQYDAALSSDGHWLYFSSDEGGPGSCGDRDMYVSYRSDPQDDMDWEASANLGCVVNSAALDAHPTIYENPETGKVTLYFISRRSGGAFPNVNVWSVTGHGSEFGSPTVEAALSSGRGARPAIRRDGLEFFMTIGPTGRWGAGHGLADIWVTKRASVHDQWEEMQNLVGPANIPINTAAIDGSPWLSWDGTRLYFYSARLVKGADQQHDLYVATRRQLH